MITEPNKSNVSQPASSPLPKSAQQSTSQPPPSSPTLAPYPSELARLSAQVAELTDALTAAQKERDQERAAAEWERVTRRQEQRAADALIEQQQQALQQQSQALQQSDLLADKLVYLRAGIWIRPVMVREIELSNSWVEVIKEHAKDRHGRQLFERNTDGTNKEIFVPAQQGPPYVPAHMRSIPVMLPEVRKEWQKLTINNDERLWTTRPPHQITDLIKELTASFDLKPQPPDGPKDPPQKPAEEPAKP